MMKLLTYFYTCACLSLVSLNANQIQLAFSGESTEEVIQILKESPALELRKSVDGKGSEVSLGEFILHVKNDSSAVYLQVRSIKSGKNCLSVKQKSEAQFYIHVIRISPPSKIDLIASFRVDKSSTYCFDANTDEPLASFEY